MVIEHTYPRFTDAEYARRDREVRERMERSEVSALVCCGFGRSAEINYLANWRTTTEAWLIYPREGDSTLLVQLSNHLPNARLMSIVDDVRFAGSGPTGSVDSVPSIVDNLKERGSPRAALASWGRCLTSTTAASERRYPTWSSSTSQRRCAINARSRALRRSSG